MKAQREQIYSTLFDLLQTLPGLYKDPDTGNVSASRRLLAFTAVPPTEMPALFMEQVGESQLEVKAGFPYRWKLTVMVGLYVFVGDDPNAVPATTMNELLDNLEKLINPTPQAKQNLGGLVYEVRISREEQIALGSIGPQAMAFVPIEIITL